MKTVFKMLCAAIIVAVICVSVVSFSARTVNGILGDADGNGKVTIMDATRIQRCLAHLDSDENHFARSFGDIDGKGLDILDATRIQRHLAGFTVNFPLGQPVSAEIADPTDEPTEEPTGEVTEQPTEEPTGDPTQEPTQEPTKKDPYELPLVD